MGIFDKIKKLIESLSPNAQDTEGPTTISAEEQEQILQELLGAAPRELVRVVALKQTVDLIKVTVETLEDHVASVAEPGDEEAIPDEPEPAEPTLIA